MRARPLAAAGALVSGALGAALLAAALIFPPGEAWAAAECGIPNQPTLNCGNAAYTDGINYDHDNPINTGGTTVNVPGRSTAATPITAAGQAAGIFLRYHGAGHITLNVGGETNGVAHVVNIRQGTNSIVGVNSGHNRFSGRNSGIYMYSRSANSPNANLDVGAGVTIGASGAPMKLHGIFIRQTHSGGLPAGQTGAGGASIINRATIHAAGQGIRFDRGAGRTDEATTITNHGAINAGVDNAADTTADLENGYELYRTRPNGIFVHQSGGHVEATGSVKIENHGAITLSGDYVGIYLNNFGSGAAEIDNSGDIDAKAGQGIRFDYNFSNNANASAVTLTNTGDVDAGLFGIRLKKNTGGATTLTNSGDVTVTGARAAGEGHAIFLAEGFATFNDGWDTSATGAVTITNSGALRSKNHALYAFIASDVTNDDDFTLTNSGSVTSEEADGIRVERNGRQSVTIENSGSVSGRWHGIYVDGATRLDFEQTGGTITARTGVYAEVLPASGQTARTVDSSNNHVPAIDIDWTGGNVARGTAADDNGRFRAGTVADVLAFDQEAEAVKALARSATYGGVHYGGPAGIEAHALSWRDVVAQVAKGDDPGMITDNAAQLAAVPTGATANDNPYVAQLRAALGNDDLAVPAAISVFLFLTDANIVTYLREDNAARRTLLRNILAQGLSDKEKAVLRAVATGDSAALTTALDDADAGFSSSYKTAVRALLDRYHLDDVRVSVTGGSIDSRGDGIRAYYATPHDMNGGISVTVAAGATVTGGLAGVYVANAGEGLTLARKYTYGYAMGDDPDELVAVMNGEGADAEPLRNQLVTVAGTVTGGTDAAVHLNGGGAVLVLEGGEVHAGASGVAIKVNDPGPALIYIDGEVKGDVDGAAAVHLTGGGSVIVGLSGSVQANGADNAIQGGGDDETMAALTLAADRPIPYREDVNAQVEGSLEGVENVVRVREYRDGVFSGYSTPLTVSANGMLDTSKLPWRTPCPEGQTRGADGVGECRTPPPPGSGSGEDGSGEDGSRRGPGMEFSCEDVEKMGDRRCRLYEALPSMLLAMNDPPSYAERTAAPRDAHGGWARVEAARGTWQAKQATTAGTLAYDHRRSMVQAGIDFITGESGRLGASMHALRGKAKMAGVGEVKLNGMGGGLSSTWLAEGFHVDAQAAVTLFDVDVESHTHGRMTKKDVAGAGYALAVDVGKRMLVRGTFVTPRAGLAWSKVDLSDFTDMERAGGQRARVSMEDVGGVKGRLGVMLETEMGAGDGRLFGSLDVEREFSDETAMKVGEEMLKTEVRPTAVRLGLGGAFEVDENTQVRVTAGYRTSGSGMSEYNGSLEVQVQF